jgi:hypothetical protein
MAYNGGSARGYERDLRHFGVTADSRPLEMIDVYDRLGEG